MVENQYVPHEDDEVEDLYELLAEMKETHPDLQAIASGLRSNHYKRLRIENCCARLGLLNLSYLWNKNEFEFIKQIKKTKTTALVSRLEYRHNVILRKTRTTVFNSPLFPTHKVEAGKREDVKKDNLDKVVFSELRLVEKTKKEKKVDKKVLAKQKNRLSYIYLGHLNG
mmetsp:Transcript_7766/g.12032  ORF Transcript_7766/g.12032 Transcript_7766/m.12032 type:complete len:169 (-) Transcript_7766:485-991(-)